MPVDSDFVYSHKTLTAKELVTLYSEKLPIIVIVVEGYQTVLDEMHAFSTGQIYRLQQLKKQPRIVARDERGNRLSIPNDYVHNMQAINIDGTVGNGEPLKEIISRWITAQPINKLRLKLTHRLEISSGTYSRPRKPTDFEILHCEGFYDECYLAGFSIMGEKIPYHPIIMPMYIESKFSKITGMKKQGKEIFHKFLTSNDPAMVENLNKITTNGEIIVFPHKTHGVNYNTVTPSCYLYSTVDESYSDHYANPRTLQPTYINPHKALVIIPKAKKDDKKSKKGATKVQNEDTRAFPGPPIPPRPTESLDRSVSVPNQMSHAYANQKHSQPANKYDLTTSQSSGLGNPNFPKTPAPNPANFQDLGNLSKDHFHVTPQAKALGSILSSSYKNPSISHPTGPPGPPSSVKNKPVISKQTSDSSLAYSDKKMNLSVEEYLVASSGSAQGDKYPSSRYSIHDDKIYHVIDSDNRPLRNIAAVPKDISKLTKIQISDCLRLLKMDQFIGHFLEADMDGQLLLDMDESILCEDFKFRRFEARKLINFAKGWRPT